MRTLVRIILVAAVAAALLPVRPAGAAGPFLFAQLSIPVGVGVDGGGNVWVDSDATFTTVLTKFAPSGQPLGQVTKGGITVGELGAIDRDPATGLLWHLSNSGTLRVIDPATGQMTPLGNLRQTAIDVSSIYDIFAERVSTLGGTVQPAFAAYGDLALLRRGARLDAFVTAISANAIPFVIRVRFENEAFVGAKVLVASSGVARAPGDLNFFTYPRGVAVNAGGGVLTTLPLGPDMAVALGADYPEAAGQTPRVALGGVDLTSKGMATDAGGNFYVATGSVGTSRCGAGGSGALVIIPRDLSGLACRTLGAALADSRDVAVANAGAQVTIYMTITAGGAVVRWEEAPPQPSRFADVSPSDPAAAAIAALTDAGIISGYATNPPTFGPGDPVQRAQMAAFVVRAFQWQGRPTGPRTFADFGNLVAELRTASLILANTCDARGNCVAKGYDGQNFGPNDRVTYAQVISFVARAFAANAQYGWQPQPGGPLPYAGVPAVHAHDLRTYTAYAGTIPDAPTTEAGWSAPAPRAWVARVLYQALQTAP